MIRFQITPILIILACSFIYCCNAAYTSEETDEKSKSLYSAVTSILQSADTSKHQHKHTYDNPPPCRNAGGCATNVPTFVVGGPPALSISPPICASPNGCPLQQSTSYGNGIVAPSSGSVPARGPPAQVGYASGGVYGNYPAPVPQSGAYGYHGQSGGYGTVGPYGPVPLQTPGGGYGYQQPNGNWYGNSGHQGYQGDRGYSVLNHSLKTNSEYTEVGTHTGPMANNGQGYGSGYGGYMGMYNRPGF